MQIGEAVHIGERFHRRSPRPWNWRAGRWRRGEKSSSSALVIAEIQQESTETSLEMVPLNVRGYISHTAEVTALLRQMFDKPFIVTLNETFLNKAIENVKFECYQVLARRNRDGQWGGREGLVFVLDE